MTRQWKGYDVDEYDESVLSKRSLAEIAGDEGSQRVEEPSCHGTRQAESCLAGGRGGQTRPEKFTPRNRRLKKNKRSKARRT